MWPFSNELKFPGVTLQPDGTIDFTLTPEEARAADAALAEFKGYVVHPDYADRIRNGTIAVALSHYARDLINANETEMAASAPVRQKVLTKAIAAVWKASSLSSLPIYMFHRASFFLMLGQQDEAKRLYGTFVKQQTAFRPDEVDQHLMTYEAFDVQKALSIATQQIG
jgi:hypothetical protein